MHRSRPAVCSVGEVQVNIVRLEEQQHHAVPTSDGRVHERRPTVAVDGGRIGTWGAADSAGFMFMLMFNDATHAVAHFIAEAQSGTSLRAHAIASDILHASTQQSFAQRADCSQASGSAQRSRSVGQRY